ncbi:MAG: hypothetical protein Q4G67_02570 [Actinomycetia bacterium]|nr:hypothetical protein [Actinomycetes bacterium]
MRGFWSRLAQGSVLVRFAGLLGLYLTIFLAAVVIGHLLLPEGLLRGYSEGRGGSAVEGFWTIAGQLVLFNLMAFGVVLVTAMFASRRDDQRAFVPTSVTVLVVLAALNGTILGTNSFAMRTENTGLIEKTVGLLDITRYAALWEIAALVLLAAALFTKALVLRTGRDTRTRRLRELTWDRGELIALAIAPALLLVGALVEAAAVARL